jgi:hypothetical protein
MSQLRRSGIFVEARLPQGFQLRGSGISCRADAAPTELGISFTSVSTKMPLLRSYQTAPSHISATSALSQRDTPTIARRFNAGTKPGGRKTIAQRFIAGFAHPGVTSPVRDERISVNVSTHPAHRFGLRLCRISAPVSAGRGQTKTPGAAQPSLRDVFGTVRKPGVETPGYCLTSLRDAKNAGGNDVSRMRGRVGIVPRLQRWVSIGAQYPGRCPRLSCRGLSGLTLAPSFWNIRHSSLAIDSDFGIRPSFGFRISVFGFLASLRLGVNNECRRVQPFLFPPRVRTGS